MGPKGIERYLTPARIVTLGFALLIILGGILLSLPIASRSGQPLNFLDALFTSTSAVCVTGLVVVDTASTFSLFGQLVILSLIQIGGLGFMTVATMVMILSGKKIGLRERLVIQEALNVSSLEGLVRLSRNVVYITLAIEAVFALILAVRFAFEMSWQRALYFGVFHSVSAFCNAGFDLFGGFKSLTDFVNDPVVNISIMALIVLGGLGFTVIVDLMNYQYTRRLSLHSKIVLVTTFILLIVGAIGYFLLEIGNPNTIGGLTPMGEFLSSFFASTTARTAGYATIDYSQISDASKLWTVLLMFIGASPGSTGGGIKTVTTAAILLFVWSMVVGKEDVEAFHRRINPRIIYKSITIVVISMLLVMSVTMILTITEHADFLRLLFEATSAFATVGLSTNLTPDLSPMGRFIILLMMYIGRVGPLTLAIALGTRRAQKAVIKQPEGKLFVG